VYAVMPERTRDPWAGSGAPPGPAGEPTVTVTTKSAIDDRDRELAHDFISLFGKALDSRDGAPRATGASGPTATTARGWLDLAETQPPAQAVVSVRHALALSPDWPEAEVALCVTLAASEDDGALAACDVAVRAKPGDTNALAARAAAHLRAGRAADAIADLDRVIAADPDPKWRRLRARAKERAGDAKGAAHDLAAACQLGDAAACGK
jgi:Flp pilus assembly protein TadD